MYRIMLFLSMLICLSSNKLSGQSVAKGKHRAFRESYDLDISEVRQGKHLAMAKPYSIKEFIEYYAEAGTEDLSRKWGKVTIKQLYADSTFTYFGRQNYKGLKDFLRVKNEELKEVNYSEFDGKAMRERFFDEIIPEADKRWVDWKTNQDSPIMVINIPSFKYDYDLATKLLKVTMKWKVHVIVERVINKTYTAQYDVNARQFVKNTE